MSPMHNDGIHVNLKETKLIILIILISFVQVKEATKSGKESLWTLMHDEISIKEDIQWDRHCFRRYVDVGDGVYDDDTPLAGHALVLMVVSVDGSCKAWLFSPTG